MYEELLVKRSAVGFQLPRFLNRKQNINDYLDIFQFWFRDVLMFKATQEIDDLVQEELESDEPYKSDGTELYSYYSRSGQIRRLLLQGYTSICI